MRIVVIGSGHVGLVTGACLADKKHNVICVDNNRSKIETLQRGVITFYEPGLAEMVHRNIKNRRLSFSSDIQKAVRFAEIIFIAVGTPLGKGGGADLSQIRRVSKEIAKHLNNQYKIIVEKSTVPAGTAEEIKRTIKFYASKNAKYEIVSNPEFLQEGTAIKTTIQPDRIILGVQSKSEESLSVHPCAKGRPSGQAEKIMRRLFRSFNSKILVTDFNSAELIKHASNSFLAMKISYINALANICERVGANIKSVAQGLGLDKRINPHFLNAGIGYGGFCLPKDVVAFIHIADKVGYNFEILKAVHNTNILQRHLFVNKIKKALNNKIEGRHIAVWGLSFKPNTDDIREAPAIYIIQALLREKAHIKTYDPQAMKETQSILSNIRYSPNAYEAARDSDCLVIATEWDEFKNISLRKLKKIMRRPIIIDGRNMFEPTTMKRLGFSYYGIGFRH
ncbi:MAG: UDP-glucose/GDP-mannose dehydrogenase family protein [Planctomycetota bacterium]